MAHALFLKAEAVEVPGASTSANLGAQRATVNRNPHWVPHLIGMYYLVGRDLLQIFPEAPWHRHQQRSFGQVLER